MDNKIKLLEDKLEQTEEKLSSTTSSLALIETVCFVSIIIYNRCKMQTIFFVSIRIVTVNFKEKDEADRTLQKLSISDGDQSDKIVELEAKLKEANMIAEEADR